MSYGFGSSVSKVKVFTLTSMAPLYINRATDAATPLNFTNHETSCSTLCPSHCCLLLSSVGSRRCGSTWSVTSYS
ncbi:hypothetical protein EB796_013839 [Bugula neritina]|uniref:Uncharacterized protein n=1 Tax=Bugula neritina TaxID=10212 RepID=A0A7J7JNB3_BUGNE|nr:hypothetical protein EB796_013839 [Bugula neritina]